MNKLILFFVALLCTGCFRDRIDIDLNEDNTKLVITGFISTLDEDQFIKVSQTVNYLGEIGEDPVSNANVSLQDDDNTYQLVERNSGFYFLPTDWQPQVGQTYRLEVMHDGQSYTAEHELRACPELENLRQIEYDDLEETDSISIYQTSFDFQEIEGVGDAYYGIDYLKGTLAGDSLLNGGFTNDEFIDGDYLEEIILTEDDRLYKVGDSVVVEIYSIGNETQKFLVDIELEIYRGGPFDPPPANVRTNISDGAVGYFIMADARQETIVIN